MFVQNVEIPIDTHGQGFRLITRIQDETHRFAIEYHRQIRGKTQVHSILDDIPTVGPTRRKALMRRYDSLDAIAGATVEELMEMPEINEASAREIVAFFAKRGNGKG